MGHILAKLQQWNEEGIDALHRPTGREFKNLNVMVGEDAFVDPVLDLYIFKPRLY